MPTERPTVAIRPRSTWEAIDLGVTLTRHWWRSIFPAWIAIAGAVFLLLHLATGGRLLLSAFLFWLLKPAFDRVLLPIYSQALFGPAPTFRDTLRRLPRIFSSGLWINLTLLRLNPSRSFHLPVWVLEGLRGQARVRRIQTLSKTIRSSPVWLLAACQAMEQVLAFAPLVLLAVFATEEINTRLLDALIAGDDLPLTLEIMGNVVYFFAVILIEPIYVAAGFMLYIDRRAKLEGWDIELAFRRLGERLRQATPATAAALLALLLTLPGQPAEAAPPSRAESRAAIDAVLHMPELDRHETRWQWHRREADQQPATPSAWATTLGQVLHYLALTFRGALWAMAALLALLLIVYRHRWLRLAERPSRAPPAEPVASVAGLDIRPASLPPDIPGAATRLVEQGKLREALALLYRASLSRLQQQDRLPLRRGHTETEILALASKLPAARRRYLARLTALWRETAYGARPASPQAALALCRQWPAFDGERS